METRANPSPIKSESPSRIRGYAASFGTPTTIVDGRGRSFTEIIHKDAFTRTLKEQPDIRMLRDHQTHLLLGRTKSGTLAVGVDNVGLWFNCTLPDTNEGRSVAEAIRRGDLDSCSFGFTVQQDAWTKGDSPTRELRDVTLYETSVVAFPAYPNGTTVDIRSLQTTWTEEEMRKAKMRHMKYKYRIMSSR